MKGKSSYYYRAVPGSRELKTSSTSQDQLIAEIEKRTAKAKPPAPVFEYKGEKLGGVVIEEGALAIPSEIFDQVAKNLSPLEQVCYFQFFRLSYGEKKNFCRVSKKELCQRTGLSVRRLNTALEGLVRKKLIKPLHRSVEGTLWRVFHPAEILEDKVSYKFKLGKEEKIKIKPKKPAPPPEKPIESPLNVERFAERGSEQPEISLKDLTEKFFKIKEHTPSPDERDEAISIITDLLEEGFSRKQILFAIEWFCQNFPQEKTLSRLPYYIAKALEEYSEK